MYEINHLTWRFNCSSESKKSLEPWICTAYFMVFQPVVIKDTSVTSFWGTCHLVHWFIKSGLKSDDVANHTKIPLNCSSSDILSWEFIMSSCKKTCSGRFAFSPALTGNVDSSEEAFIYFEVQKKFILVAFANNWISSNKKTFWKYKACKGTVPLRQK